ncbi:MAG: lytic transglycosylase domain-containing protein [Clostridiales bacterium]|nr:lytic transglycosylase domain-containing protein [Clostridiales bacterium]
MQGKRKQNRANYGRIGVIIALIAVIIFVVVVVRSCGADTEPANTGTSENGAYTENENTEVSTEGEISADTQIADTEGAETETSTETENTETEISVDIETEATEEETASHDIPDISGLEYPFNTMSLDWGEDTLDGWYHYDIPTEYVQTGGYFPDAVQVYTYALCKQNGIDYPTVLAVIEVESSYQYDAVSESGALGYMQLVPKYHSERLGGTTSEDVFLNPYQNIYAGISFLAELSEKYGTDDEVLTAYHYGVSGARSLFWSEGETGSSYSDKVLEVAERINSELYGEE